MKMHRVSNPPLNSGAASQSRLSLVFFTGPKDDAMIEVMPTCLTSIDETPKFKPIRSGDFLREKLKSSNV
jgi:isopenicillin N synthase-like dioxygenase